MIKKKPCFILEKYFQKDSNIISIILQCAETFIILSMIYSPDDGNL